MNQYELTPEHEKQLLTYKDRWIKIAFRTDTMTDVEKEQCINAINGIYKVAGQTEPKEIVFVSSPFVMQFAAGAAAAIIEKRKENKEFAKGITVQDIADKTLELMKQKKPTLEKHYLVSVVAKELDIFYKLKGLGVEYTKQMYKLRQYGNQEAYVASFYSFFRDVAELDKTHNVDFTNWNLWETLIIHSGPRIVHDDFCIISDFPEKIYLDERSLGHNLTTSFKHWRDGSQVFKVHGINVPAWIILEKHTITPQLIDKEKNIEVRRVMIEIYGEERYLLEGNYKVLDTDVDSAANPRRVLMSKNGEDEPIVRVEVHNSSPELDNTYRKYYLPVDFEGRPIFPGLKGKALLEALEKSKDMTRAEQIRVGYLGKPQNLTCHNLVASTFGLYGNEFKVNGQIRQGDVLITFRDGSNNLPYRES